MSRCGVIHREPADGELEQVRFVCDLDSGHGPVHHDRSKSMRWLIPQFGGPVHRRPMDVWLIVERRYPNRGDGAHWAWFCVRCAGDGRWWGEAGSQPAALALADQHLLTCPSYRRGLDRLVAAVFEPVGACVVLDAGDSITLTTTITTD